MTIAIIVASFISTYHLVECFSLATQRVKLGPDDTCPSDGITCYGKHDGFGARYFAEMTVFAYAQANNRTFCHHTWDALDHDESATTMEAFTGVALLGPPANEDTEQIPYANIGDFGGYMWADPTIADKMRDAYLQGRAESSDSTLSFSKDDNIAIHIRRGDVGGDFDGCKDSDNGGGRCSPDTVVRDAMQTLANNDTYKSCEVHFFSEGSMDMFTSLDETCKQLFSQCVWHLDEDLTISFDHFVMSGTLVSGPSALSTAASALRGFSMSSFFIDDLANGIMVESWGGHGSHWRLPINTLIDDASED